MMLARLLIVLVLASSVTPALAWFRHGGGGGGPVLPVITAPATATVPSNTATTVAGVSISKSGAVGTDLFTSVISDTNGILNVTNAASSIDPGSSGCGTANGTVITCVQTINSANELLVAFIAPNGGPVVSVADLLSLTWTKRASVTPCVGGGGHSQTLEEWTAPGPTGGSYPQTDTITITATTIDFLQANVAGVIGAHLSAPFDAAHATTMAGTCSGGADPISIPTTNTNTVALGGFRNANNPSPGPGAQWTALPNRNYTLAEYQFFTAAQASILINEATNGDAQAVIGDAIVLNTAPSYVLGGGTNRMQIGPTALTNVNTALATLTFQGTVNDNIVINATDNVGNPALQQTIAVAIGSTPPGLPVIAVPSNITVPSGVTTAISGSSLSETNPAVGETFTMDYADANAILTASGTGVSGSGSAHITIGPTSLDNVNAALLTLSINASASDSIHVTASDSLGGVATPKDIVVTVTGGGNLNTYFVAANGSDSNNGTSSATPWQTIAHVNATTLVANPIVSFRGGDTFSGGIVVNNANATITSYGSGQPTISSGNSAACVTAINAISVIITNLICTGGGDTTNTTSGILVQNTSGHSIVGPTITNNTVSGYGGSGVLLLGSIASSAEWLLNQFQCRA